MTRSKQELLVAALLVGACGWFLIASYSYGPRARLVPVPVAVVTILLILGDQIIDRVFKKRFVVDADDIFVKARVDATCEPGSVIREEGGKEWVALSLVVLLLGLVVLFGIIAGLFLFVFIFFRFLNKAGLLASVLWSIGLTGGVYVLFGLALRVVFYKGFLITLFS